MFKVIALKVHSEQVLAMLKGMEGRSRNLAPVMLDFGGRMKGSIDKNFDDQGRPVRWPGLKPATMRNWLFGKKGHWTKAGNLSKEGKESLGSRKVLVDSGLLRRTIYYQPSGSGITIGSRKPYAGIHQFGGTTKPHEIVPRKKKALAWPGGAHPVKRVQHPGSKIPPRPFLLFQVDDLAYLQMRLGDYVTAGGAK
jgi:phage gpG-like protein